MGDKRIALAEETRERLKERKRGDDTYDDVLQRLLDGGDADFSATAEITPTLDEEAVEAIREELEAVENGADTETILQAVGAVEERVGRMEQRLEELGA